MPTEYLLEEPAHYAPEPRTSAAEPTPAPHSAAVIFVRELGRHKRFIAAVTAVAMAAGVVYSLTLPVLFTATTRILTPQQAPSAAAMVMSQLASSGAGALAAAAGAGLGLHNPNDLYIGLLQSQPVADAILEKFGLAAVYKAKYPSVYNVGLLIEAMPRVLSQYPRTRLAVLGDGSLKTELENRSRELGISQSVTFLGRRTQIEVASCLSQADAYVSTSLSDGSSISLNEAMACGAFPVVTDIPANREWIEDGRNGYLVDTKDPGHLAARVVEALGNPELQRSAAERNWELVQHGASWKNAMKRMEVEYSAVLERCGRPAVGARA